MCQIGELVSFDLSRIVDEHLAESEESDPRELAKNIASTIHSSNLRVALETTLVSYVSTRIGLRRMSNPIVGSGKYVPEEIAPTRIQQKSHKVALHQQWNEALRDRINVGPGEWKTLGECNRDDIRYAAELREKRAENLRESAQRFWTLLETMTEHKVERVADLPESALPQERLSAEVSV
jgi:hypothetical protein